MTEILFLAEFWQVFGALLIPLAIMAIFAVVIIAFVLKSKVAEQLRKRDIDLSRSQRPFTDGNCRTRQENDYLAAKCRQLAERNVAANDGSHEHIGGKLEKYDKIVGSLGEVDDEGCDELDGVRLIEHDESYCDDPEHFAQADVSELQKAIVLGEVLNNPRFANPYRKK